MINTAYITRHPFQVSDFVIDHNIRLMTEIGRIVRESAEFFDIPGRVTLVAAGTWTSPFIKGEDMCGYYVQVQPHILYREDSKTNDAMKMVTKRFKASFESREDYVEVIGDTLSCYVVAKKVSG